MPLLHAEKPPLAVWELCKFYKHRVLLTDFSRARNCTAPPLGCSPPAEWEHALLSAGTAPLAEQKERRISKLHSQQRLLCLQQKIRPLTKIFKLEQKSGDYTKPSSCLDSWVSDMVYWCENIASSESSRIYLFVLCMNLLVKLLFCNLSHRVFWTQQYFSRSQYFGVCSCHFKKPEYILTFSKAKSQYWNLHVCFNFQYAGGFILKGLNAHRSYPIQGAAETAHCWSEATYIAHVCVSVYDFQDFRRGFLPFAGEII